VFWFRPERVARLARAVHSVRQAGEGLDLRERKRQPAQTGTAGTNPGLARSGSLGVAASGFRDTGLSIQRQGRGSAPSSQYDYFDWSPRRRISLPPESADVYMLVPIREFQRLRRCVAEDLKPSSDSLAGVYFTLFGAALATAVAVPPLLTSRGLPSWIIPTFIVSAAAFLLLGGTLLIVSRALGIGRRKIGAGIIEEMIQIERAYHGGTASDLVEPIGQNQ